MKKGKTEKRAEVRFSLRQKKPICYNGWTPLGGLIAGVLTIMGDLMMLWSDRSEKRIQEAAVKAKAEGIEEGKKELT